MEKLNKVIAGMEACKGVGDNCNRCPYVGEDEKCSGVLWADTLAVLKARKGDLISRRALIKKMFPYGMPDNGNYPINARAVMEALTKAAAVGVEVCEGGDLISRSALLEEYEWLKSQVNPCSVAEVEEHIARIRRIPAVEAEPVVHAHWEGDWCSLCGELSEQCYPRCPYCGAHMDEVVADES